MTLQSRQMWYNTRSWQVLGLLLLLLLLPAPLQAEEVPPAQNAIYFPLVQGRTTHTYYVPLWSVTERSKLGLAGGTAEQANTLGANWTYNWGTHPPIWDEHFDAVPMLWGQFNIQPDWCPALGGNSRWLLSGNECDLANQCNTAAKYYAVIWKRIEECYPDRLLVSPAPSDTGRYWLTELRSEYYKLYGQYPRFDALAMHCYQWTAAGCEPVLQDYLTWARDWHIAEIWVTEFSFVPAWSGNAKLEAQKFITRLEAESLVKRYAPFTGYVQPGVWYWPDTRASANPSLFMGLTSLMLTETGKWYAR